MSVPLGTIIIWPGATAPTGWLLCFGQAVNRITYADLFAIISTTFGVGDGSTTFNVPDFRNRFALQGDVVGAAGGSALHVLTVAEMASHRHRVRAAGNDPADLAIPTTNRNLARVSGAQIYIEDATSTDLAEDSTSLAGQGEGHNNMPPYLSINFIILSENP